MCFRYPQGPDRTPEAASRGRSSGALFRPLTGPGRRRAQPAQTGRASGGAGRAGRGGRYRARRRGAKGATLPPPGGCPAVTPWICPFPVPQRPPAICARCAPRSRPPWTRRGRPAAATAALPLLRPPPHCVAVCPRDHPMDAGVFSGPPAPRSAGGRARGPRVACSPALPPGPPGPHRERRDRRSDDGGDDRRPLPAPDRSLRRSPWARSGQATSGEVRDGFRDGR